MRLFDYTARAIDGSAQQGQLEAPSASQVAEQLQSQGLTPLKISAVKTSSSKVAAKQWQWRRQQVTLDDQVMLCRQLGSLIRAGVPLMSAIRGLAGTLQCPPLSEALNQVATELEKGHTLSQAMNQHPEAFPRLLVGMVRIGENTGGLDDSFARMAEYLELERQTRRSISQAVRYPLFVVAALIFAVAVINLWVIPAFESVFDALGGSLPWQTQILIAASDITRDYAIWWLVLVAVSALAAKRWLNTDKGQLEWHRQQLRLPLLGGIFYRAALGRFARTFSLVLRAGMPIEQGLALVAQALGNRHIGQRVSQMRKGIERGEGFSLAAGRTEMFSPLIMQMIAVGEQTGRLDEMLAEAADFYEQEVAYQVRGLSSAIEPLLICAVAAMVLVLALGVFLPLWELSGAVS